MGLRKRLREAILPQNKEQRKKIDEAIKKSFTPEQRLTIHRSDMPPVAATLLTIVGIIIVSIMFASITFQSYALREAFGDNVWENFDERGFERAMEETAIGILPWMVIIGTFILLGICGVGFWFWAIRERKLEREVWARIEKEKKI